MRRVAAIVAAATAAAASLTAACGGGGDGATSSKDDIAAGQSLYAANCASCHGANGEGGTGPTLRAKEYLEDASVEQLGNQIEVGIPGTAMRAWGTDFGGPFDEDKVKQVASYVLSWKDDAPSVPNRRATQSTTTTKAP